MKNPILFVLTVTVALLGWLNPSKADFVTYYAKHGDWTVACATNPRAEDLRYCRASIPGPVTALPGSQHAVLNLTITETGKTDLKLAIHGLFPRPKTASLVVGGQSFRTLLSFHGEALWTPEEAPELFTLMGTTDTVGIRVDEALDTGRDWTFPASGLATAIAVIRQRLGLRP